MTMAAEIYNVVDQQGVFVVELLLPSTLDVEDFDRLNESLLGRIRANPDAKWLIDLSNSSYMGSAALGLLVNVRQQVKQSGGRLILCGLSDTLMNIFRTCCMERLFTIVHDREQGLAPSAW